MWLEFNGLVRSSAPWSAMISLLRGSNQLYELSVLSGKDMAVGAVDLSGVYRTVFVPMHGKMLLI